jgi:hypothetical protein
MKSQVSFDISGAIRKAFNMVINNNNDLIKKKKMEWKSKQITVLSDIVKSSEGDEFPGLFSMKFSNNCWSSDNKRLLVATQWKRANVI